MMPTKRSPRVAQRAGEDARLLHLGAATVAALRATLLRRYGFTRLDVDLKIDRDAKRLIIAGEALLPSVAAALGRALEAQLPRGWTLAPGELRVSQARAWRALVAPSTRLYGAHPRLVQNAAQSTELLATDGAVAVLASHTDHALVRSMDGTVGWTDAELGVVVEPPRIARARGSDADLALLLRSYLGAPYQLGGTTRRGVDCSGLSQRAFREALGALLPRHSTDQLRWGGPAHRALGETGDLVFTMDSGEGHCHVGVLIASKGHTPTVIHASTSRQRVVEDLLARFTRDAPRVAHVPIEQTLEQHARSVGASSLDLSMSMPSLKGAAA